MESEEVQEEIGTIPMPKFFIPFATSSEQSEDVYSGLRKQNQYQLVHSTARLFKISFRYHKQMLIAEVGKVIEGWPEDAGPVLAVVEGTNLVTIHTQLRGGLSASPILVGPEEITARTYFDDFPVT